MSKEHLALVSRDDWVSLLLGPTWIVLGGLALAGGELVFGGIVLAVGVAFLVQAI